MNVFFISDTHFNHEKVLTFEPQSRPFPAIEAHDEALIANWNARVRPKDIVWHLGDVYLGHDREQFLKLMRRLNGDKRLIRGNHDTLPLAVYEQAFNEVLGVWPKYGFVMSHVPLHPDSVERWGVNVHGHLHSNRIMRHRRSGFFTYHEPDPRYVCVSVNQTGLAPISLDELRKIIEAGRV